jgi:hypothetical protein
MASKQTERLVSQLRASGADVRRNGMRWRVTQPGKELAFVPVVDPAPRGLANKIADLRRKGYAV